jgi:hypothetical protein
MYAPKLLNLIEQNYNTIEREALIMVYTLHKFRHYLLSDWFIFYVDHMALMYLVNKSQISNKIARWSLLLFFNMISYIYIYI